MPIRFKFRSSPAFDSIDLAGAAAIPLRDLRSRILSQNNLDTTGQFHLIISDAHSGREFNSKDEELMIADGSDVVIRRVPADTRASDPNTFASSPSPSENIDLDNFNDFGNDFYPIHDSSMPYSDFEDNDTTQCNFDQDNPRCTEAYASLCTNNERSDLNEDVLKDNSVKNGDQLCVKRERNKNWKSTCKPEEANNFRGINDFSSPLFPSSDIPVELKCSLCNLVFKEAVMIPCCQHSFCEKCIRSALTEKSSCPICCSKKFGVDDLLPNVSLRHAIEHFPEVRMANSSSDKLVCENAPDVESGIRGKDVLCPSSFHPQELEAPFPESSSATGRGSNLDPTETINESQTKRKDVATKGSPIIYLYSKKPEKSGPLGTNGKEQPFNGQSVPQNPLVVASELPRNSQSAVEGNLLTKKKRGILANMTDLSSGAPTSRLRKGDRNCFMCGSPDHLIRDCPVGCSQQSKLQTGEVLAGSFPPYRQAYWHGNPYIPMRTYTNYYGSSNVVPIHPGIVPITTFPAPSYMPHFYSGLTVSCGFMGMNGISLTPTARAGCPTHTVYGNEALDLHECERKEIPWNEPSERKRDIADDQAYSSHDHHSCDTHKRFYDHKMKIIDTSSKSHSGHHSTRLHEKHSAVKDYYDSSCYENHFSDDDVPVGHDHMLRKVNQASTSKRHQRLHHTKESSSDIQYASDTSYLHGKERKKRREDSHSRNHDGWSEHDGSTDQENSQIYCKEPTERDHRALKKSKIDHNYKDSDQDCDYSNHRHHRKRSSHHSRTSKDLDPLSDDQMVTDGGRWEMVDAFHDSHEDYHYHKQRSR